MAQNNKHISHICGIQQIYTELVWTLLIHSCVCGLALVSRISFSWDQWAYSACPLMAMAEVQEGKWKYLRPIETWAWNYTTLFLPHSTCQSKSHHWAHNSSTRTFVFTSEGSCLLTNLSERKGHRKHISPVSPPTDARLQDFYFFNLFLQPEVSPSSRNYGLSSCYVQLITKGIKGWPRECLLPMFTFNSDINKVNELTWTCLTS